MKESPLKGDEVVPPNPMKLYVNFSCVLLVILFELGVVAPYLISSESDVLVVLGIISLILLVPFTYYAYNWSVKNGN